MAFDQKTRNLLQRTVAACRRVLDVEFTAQLQELYGIQPDGSLAPITALDDLGDEELEVARLLRERINHLEGGSAIESLSRTQARPEHVARVIREQAFTVLNRLAALRLCEERGLVLECVRQGVNSEGFQLFMSSAGNSLGETRDAYRVFLHCLFDELALDLGVLFDRFSPLALLFPGHDALTEVLRELNGSGRAAEREEISPEHFAEIWRADETIGWIYQYYNDEIERKKMRQESATPRNSRELAVRNQFFTPRYVVEFLTDNSLGRIWYEMTQGETMLKDQCRYLVRRPSEVFLKPGEPAPARPKQENLAQEDPNHIPHRPLKDPRTILVLDPACGSMHFGLYAFDLFEVIYDEAWELEGKFGTDVLNRPPGMKSLHDTYVNRGELQKDAPRLIIENNLHGVDIDPRCAQIAGLSLWLRAQKAWQQSGFKPAERPAITRSNIVCAEPMPGEKELLREFVEREFPETERDIFKLLLEVIFDKMQLAGEAGSLLKVEEEIRSAITEAKQLYEQDPHLEQSTLFAELETAQQTELKFNLSGITDEQFWGTVESRIYGALQKYAEQTVSGGFQRRLFAEDAARGFAFIDVCRKRYDVAVMNPPFGAFSRASKAYAAEQFPNSANDILAAFIECSLSRLIAAGLLGAITSRTGFFTASFADWRREVVRKRARLICFSDLGVGVMDKATVEAAAYILLRSETPNARDEPTPFVRLLVQRDKEPELAEAVQTLREGRGHDRRIFWAGYGQFDLLPEAPFVYWASSTTLGKLVRWPCFEPSAAQVRKGLRTGDNFRFVRALWEIPSSDFTPAISANSALSEREGSKWVPLVLSGSSQPWFSPLLVALNWRANGQELRQYVTKYGSASRLIQAEDFYFRPGMSWTRRAARFVPYAIPGGCIPTGSRPMAFPNDGLAFVALAVSGCRIASAFMRFYGDWFTRPNFLEGKVKLFPWPDLPPETSRNLIFLARREADRRRFGYRGHEPFFDFIKPFDVDNDEGVASINIDWATLLGPDLEAAVENSYGLNPSAAEELYRDLDESLAVRSASPESDGENEGDDGSEDEDVDEDVELLLDCSDRSRVETRASHALGCSFGRWDIRFATGEKAAPELPDPFAPLPSCPPGQLQNAEGQAASRPDVPAAYPVRIPWDGILVDDPNHPLDIERRVREVIEIIWSGAASTPRSGGPTARAIEHKACEILGVKSWREYFRKPTGFFADHLKRYSKSRRQAPIYWPLSSAGGGYTLWLYYHRLTPDTLYKCVQLVSLKLAEVEKERTHVRAILAANEGGAKERKGLEALEDLRRELIDLRTELELWAPKWKPNLNDGVLITAAPLWTLFRLPKWRKDLKACWQKIEKGDYDWAHLAYTLWPDRVREKCKTDRSLAIAHGVEELCEVKAPEKKAKKKAGKSEAELLM